MRKTNVVRLFGLLTVLTAWAVGAYAQTYIRAVLPNPGNKPATGYRFQILTPGEVSQGIIRAYPEGQLLEGQPSIRMASFSEREAIPGNSALRSSLPRLVTGLNSDRRTMSFAFDDAISARGQIDLRVAFTPSDYWRVYFNDVFEYAGGRSVRSRIPYAAFFINITPTKDPSKMMASLTVVNNLASTYGIPTSVVDDSGRLPINFRRAQVYVNNSMSHYDLMHFDQPDGRALDLPSSFSLKPGEAQTFELGLVEANSYIYTVSEIGYEGVDEHYGVACAHPAKPTKLK